MGAVFSLMARNDRYRNLRLNIDHMTYEVRAVLSSRATQLLELSNRIGYVSTGLNEVVIASCLMRSRMRKPGPNKTCPICQEEYMPREDTGKLRNCGHLYHTDCIKQWLRQKNTCPVCKTSVALPRT